jgi:polar amino acid transport system ATP-binding protein
LQCLNFLHLPDAGRILLEGREVDPRSRKGLYAYRQQGRHDLPVTIICSDLPERARQTSPRPAQGEGNGPRRAELRGGAELDRVGLADKARLYPAELSGGQNAAGLDRPQPWRWIPR